MIMTVNHNGGVVTCRNDKDYLVASINGEDGLWYVRFEHRDLVHCNTGFNSLLAAEYYVFAMSIELDSN